MSRDNEEFRGQEAIEHLKRWIEERRAIIQDARATLYPKKRELHVGILSIEGDLVWTLREHRGDLIFELNSRYGLEAFVKVYSDREREIFENSHRSNSASYNYNNH
jgi:hypothetical protein